MCMLVIMLVYILFSYSYMCMPICLQMAADLRLTHALFNLGMMHTAGDGVAQVSDIYVYVYVYICGVYVYITLCYSSVMYA